MRHSKFRSIRSNFYYVEKIGNFSMLENVLYEEKITLKIKNQLLELNFVSFMII